MQAQGGMSVAKTKPLILPWSEERRRFQRVKVNLLGRYMLADRREFPCQVINMSPGGMALVAPVAGKPGERVIAYVDHVGRLEGMIARRIENGFAMTIGATARKRDKLAAQLTWLANRGILGLPEDRRHGRITPRNPMARLILPNGVNLTCRVIDISQSVRRSPATSGRRWAPWSPSARRRAASSVTSRRGSRSNSSACSTPTSSKRMLPAGERRRPGPAAAGRPGHLARPLLQSDHVKAARRAG